MTYDVLIIGGGPGGIYTAWELLNKRPDLKLALFKPLRRWLNMLKTKYEKRWVP